MGTQCKDGLVNVESNLADKKSSVKILFGITVDAYDTIENIYIETIFAGWRFPKKMANVYKFDINNIAQTKSFDKQLFRVLTPRVLQYLQISIFGLIIYSCDDWNGPTFDFVNHVLW